MPTLKNLSAIDDVSAEAVSPISPPLAYENGGRLELFWDGSDKPFSKMKKVPAWNAVSFFNTFPISALA